MLDIGKRVNSTRRYNNPKFICTEYLYALKYIYNIYSRCRKQTLIEVKEKKDKSTIIVGDLKTPFLVAYSSSRKINQYKYRRFEECY